jgi:hypothetical protein
VEFSKLQNLATVMSAADETPLELSILSTKVGSVRDRLLHANQSTPPWALICAMTGSQPTWAPTLWFNTRDRGALRPHDAADAHKRVRQLLLFFLTVPRSPMLHFFCCFIVQAFGHFESSWTLAGWRCITASHCPSQVSTRYASPAILHVECQPHKRFYWTHLAALYFASRHISPRHFNVRSCRVTAFDGSLNVKPIACICGPGAAVQQ